MAHIVTRTVTRIATQIVTRIVTQIVTRIVTQIVTQIMTQIVTQIVAEGVAFRSHHRLSIVRPLQGRPYMRKVICRGNETRTVKPSNNA